MHLLGPETSSDENRRSALLDKSSLLQNSESNNRVRVSQNPGSSAELLSSSGTIGGWSQAMDCNGMHFATTSTSSMIPISESSMSQTPQAETGARMQEITGRFGITHAPNHGVPPLGTSYATSPQRLGSGPLVRGNSWNIVDTPNKVSSPMIASSGVVALQGAGIATSHCLAHFSSDAGFAERAAKFSSLSNGNYYSQTSYALGPDGRKPRGRSIAGDKDGKLSRSSSCSKVANLAPSCITTVRISHGTENSKSPEIKACKLKDQATTMEYDGRDMEKSQVMHDEKKLLQLGVVGDRTSMETFEGATEIDGSDPNDTDEADGLEYSSCYEQACGDRIDHGHSTVRSGSIEKAKLLQADENFHKEPGGNSIPSSRGREGQAGDGDEITAKRQRSGESTKEEAKLRTDRTFSESYSGDSSPLSMKESLKLSEPPKQDYIHVRARRGQATDSHSLAERVRREKIGERMKFLQDLVPGCSKVTGKAVMLDEIINYVQSLQRQVEFLSMKLAAVNPRLDFDITNFLAQMQSHASTAMMVGPDPTTTSYGHHQQPQQHQVHNPWPLGPSGLDFTPGNSASEGCIQRTISAPVAAPQSCLDAFADNLSQLSSAWEGELQSMVHMGFLQEHHCQIPATHMKLEL